MRIDLRILRRLLLSTLGKKRIAKSIRWLAHLIQIDLITLGYNDAGILNYENQVESGEEYLVFRVLPKIFSSTDRLTFFDIGANVGDVSRRLHGIFPTARLFAFEPNPATFCTLTEGFKNSEVLCHRMGLGSERGEGTLYCYANDQQSGHATIYRESFKLYADYGITKAEKLTSFTFPISTIDAIVAESQISELHFVKIDVEGHELEVLKGAKNTLGARKISLIQFEITDCNVLSRTFLKDFYDLLPHFHFFRLTKDGLISLGRYATKHEIFQFQNILAVRDDFLSRADPFVLK